MRRLALGCALLVFAPAPLAADLFFSPEQVKKDVTAHEATRRRDAVQKLDAFLAEEARPLLLRALADADAEVRIAAARSLGHHRIAEAVAPLVGALLDTDARLRAAAAEALGAILPDRQDKEGQRAAAALVRALSDAERDVRDAAVRALATLPAALGRGSAVALAARLDDDNAVVREHAALALGKMRDPASVVPLIAGLSDETREVRAAALTALAGLGDARAAPAMIRLLRDPADEVRAAAAAGIGRLCAEATSANPEMMARALGPLIDVMHHGHPDSLRAQAAFAIGQLGRAGSAAATPALVASLDEDEPVPALRDAIVRAGKSAVPALMEHLSHAATGRARFDVELLAAIGDDRATPMLLDELARRRLPEELLIDALGQMLRAGDRRPLVELCARLQSGSPSSRRHAALALAGSLDTRAITLLRAAAKDQEGVVRVIAISELGRLGARDALPELAAALASADAGAAEAAAQALGKLGAKSARDLLIAALGKSERAVRREAASSLMRVADRDALPTLMRAVRTQAPEKRAAAIDALSAVVRHRPDAIARELLLSYAENEDAETALAAIDALGAMGDRAAVHRLRRIVEARGSSDRRLRALAALGDLGGGDAIAALKAALADGDASVRAEAAWALGKEDRLDDATRKALADAAADAAPAVRANAAAAVARQRRRPPSGDWVLLHVIDFDGAPLVHVPYRLVLPGGLVKEGVTDERGVVREESVPTGACRLVLDGVDGPG